MTALVPCEPALGLAADVAATIRRAAPLLQSHRVIVLATWSSIAPAAGLARAALPGGIVDLGVCNWDRDQQERAHRCAQEALAIAQECGLDAELEVRLGVGGWAAEVAAFACERRVGVILLSQPRRARSLRRALARDRRGGGPSGSPLLLVAA